MINNNKNEGENEKYHKDTHSVHPPSLSAWGMFEPPTKFSKGEGLGRISVFRGGLLGKRSDFFQEGVT